MVRSNPSCFKIRRPRTNMKFQISSFRSAPRTLRVRHGERKTDWTLLPRDTSSGPASSVADGGCSRRGRGGFFLLLPVRDGRLDGVLGEDRAVNLHWRKAQFAHDIRVRDGQRFLDRFALDPLGGERRAGNCRAAAKSLELGLFDDLRFGIDLHLQPHDVAAFGRAHQASAHIWIFLGQAADVSRMLVMIDYLIGISHFTLLRYLTNESLFRILFNVPPKRPNSSC